MKALEIHKDYRTILKIELEERCRQNPRYSLRAFARDLEVSPGTLSEVFAGKHGLSRRAADTIARRLGYSEAEREAFCDLVESVGSRSETRRTLARVRLEKNTVEPKYQNLQMDAFNVISDWHHYAILELTYLDQFESNLKWIASTLGIQEAVASLAIERLKRLGMIEEKKGALNAVEDFTASPDGIPSRSLKNFHRQVLEKAVAAIQVQPVSERNFSATIMAIDRTKINDVKASIKTFQRSISKQMSESKKKNSVYCLSVQFFRINNHVD